MLLLLLLVGAGYAAFSLAFQPDRKSAFREIGGIDLSINLFGVEDSLVPITDSRRLYNSVFNDLPAEAHGHTPWLNRPAPSQ